MHRTISVGECKMRTLDGHWVRWSPLGPPWTWGYASGWSACDLFSFLFYSTFSFSDCWSIDVLLHFCLHFCHHFLSLAHSSFSLVTLHCAALLRLDSVLQTSEVSESTRLMLVKLCHLVDKMIWNVIYLGALMLTLCNRFYGCFKLTELYGFLRTTDFSLHLRPNPPIWTRLLSGIPTVNKTTTTESRMFLMNTVV